ncbi:MAG: hypothetical protein E6I50_01345, partial [Chloroflexi bacterium]
MKVVSRFGVPLLIYIFLIAMTIFALFPAFFVVQAAFRPGQSLYSLSLSLWPDHPTLDNFTYIFTKIPFPTWLRNSLGVSIGTMIAGLIGSATGAYALSR